MSDIQALLKELETVLFHTSVSHYASVSSLCLYAYDFILTFPAEVEYFWGSPWSFVKGLFFWNRYFVFPVVVYITFSEINRRPTLGLCDTLSLSFWRTLMRSSGFAEELMGVVLSIICIGVAQVIMQLRVHALYGQDRNLKIIISLLFFFAVSSELSIGITKLATDNSFIQAIPFLIDPLSLCVGTIPKYLIFYPVPMMTFDTILLVLVVYKAYLIQREEASSAVASRSWTGARLIRIIFRDSVIYFACTVGVNLLNVLLWAVGPFDLFTVGTAWAITVPAMAASRILFNMRKVYNYRPTTAFDANIGTELKAARRPGVSNGTMVWSSSSGDPESSFVPSY
ncbi:hypothetical protein FB451DRAFT_1531431 [Mycena latifolia]|nr:hypothetical protein FB451DRAFT_1531431 [Mycena latifolia]